MDQLVSYHEFFRDYVLHDLSFVVRRQVRRNHLVMIDQCVAYPHGLERSQLPAPFVHPLVVTFRGLLLLCLLLF